MPSSESTEIILGSGRLFIMLYAGGMDKIPDDTIVETDDNNVGRISGGASLEYKPTLYEVKDDDNCVVRRSITKEEVTFKSGVLTWAMENLAKFAPATLSNDAAKHEKVLKIGGKSKLDSYIVRFVHTKDDGNKLRVSLVGNASNGFTLKFNPDKETVIDAEYKALSQSDGTLVEIRDQYTPAAFAVNGAAVSGGKVILTMSDTVSAAPKDGFTVMVAGSADVVSAAAIGTDKKSIELTLTTAPTSGQAVTVAYAKPVDAEKQVVSASNTALDTFSAITATY